MMSLEVVFLHFCLKVGHLGPLFHLCTSSPAERCDPYVFYKKLRQILSGWNNNPVVPDGIIYEGVSDEPKKYNGGSAAQSSTIQAIDIALGIRHHPVRKPEESDAEYADHAGHDKYAMCPAERLLFSA